MAEGSPDILENLFALINSRKDADPECSHTARLYAKGRKKIAQKVGEEAVEIAIASLVESREDVVGESADLLYHLLVLWSDCGIVPSDVWQAMQDRFGEDGIDGKKARPL
ncbi:MULTISPECIES: phosphoribosyl-ATP diphosphatase [unclassified Haematospirillum]|uniref:phosphoribosyl-ATP diphosphatase n=1 Tax=unclassified Haematospirillum TaxID=2622088 RepID=UPI0014394CAB|nr:MULTISPECIES: phosphoribosyl-ATP diphosphatase [unclassified Haematospirillum]NKD55613.1 phosphoribosyl-ATP diphosphatase [Haematospirillum sp. H4890]NKD75752.1 phosphoribosyl-ATP diphosphatase [Haematospirillum sp. H4485]NKD88256.1 phosphoribosyl-ATP diphosphatase [Haematospirillum sp. 15-248]